MPAMSTQDRSGGNNRADDKAVGASLCSMCSQIINLDQTLSIDASFNHHSTLDDLICSGQRGCPLCSAVCAVHENSQKYGLYRYDLDEYLGRKDTQITCWFTGRAGEPTPTYLRWCIGDSDVIGLLSTFTYEGGLRDNYTLELGAIF
jgi:hypothetical protein